MATIQTKFNIGDVVYLIIGMKISSITIDHIDIKVRRKFGYVKYGSGDTLVYNWYDESDLFSSKEELINHLINS